MRCSEDDFGAVLDAIYDAAVAADGWPAVLRRVAALFDSHFADLFARSWDWSAFHGIAIGLDRSDYEDQFLGQWTNRNVWTQASPASVAGEVKPTWQMVSKPEVLQSPIYNEYLRDRGLHEGLRLVLWSGDGWLQDISLLRPWSAGPFGEHEVAAGRALLPHLQRASSASRGLRGVDALAAFDTLDQAAFLLTAQGRVLRHNASAEPMLASGGLRLSAGMLEAGTSEETARLSAAVARAGCIGGAAPQGATVCIAGAGAAQTLTLTVLPVHDRAIFEAPAPRSVLVLAGRTRGAALDPADLQRRYGLTPAEAALSTELLAGRRLAEIAAARGRSVNTLRTQLAGIMLKTGTKRQSELLLVLSQSA